MNPSEPKDVSEIRARLAKKNVENIAVKLKAGKTLSSSERKALVDLGEVESGGWVKDLSSLAKELGLTRQAVYDARARFPDAPKKHEDGKRENLVAWQQFCGDNLIGKDTATKNLAELKAQLMQREITLRDMKIAREAGETIAKEIVDDMFATLAQKLDLLLRLKLEVELGQRIIGKNAAEANVEGALILDEIREVINANIALYQNDMVARSANSEVSQ
jgi:hypothetical protein